VRAASNCECPREADVLEAVSMGRWPGCGDADLAAHVASCAICADVVSVALALQDDRRTASAAAVVPASGLVWWRIELRARQEAARMAARPIAIVQAAAAVCVAGAILTLMATASPWFANWFAGVRGLADSVDLAASAATTTATLSLTGWALALTLIAWLILAPLAVYFAVSKD
jgi:hypothetical protein